MNIAFKNVDVLPSLIEEENQKIADVLHKLRDLKGITHRVGCSPLSGDGYLPIIFTNPVDESAMGIRVGGFEDVMRFLNGYLDRCLAEEKEVSEKGLLS